LVLSASGGLKSNQKAAKWKQKTITKILGAAEDASQDEIERLYKRIAKQHHSFLIAVAMRKI